MLTFITGGTSSGQVREYDTADLPGSGQSLQVEGAHRCAPTSQEGSLPPARAIPTDWDEDCGPVSGAGWDVPRGEHFYGYIRLIWHGGLVDEGYTR